jgi:hypothetical protein
MEGTARCEASQDREARRAPPLRQYVQDWLAGNVRRPDGTVVAGPTPRAWKGLNKPHRTDRRWSLAWSPEEIAQRLKIDFPDDESMRISHEAIYQSLFIEGRGALKIIGTGRSAIGTLVEPSSRSTLLVHLPRVEGWGQKPYVKNGPSLGGYGAAAMNSPLRASMTKLPEQLRKTLTWDRGKELSGHALFALETGTRVFFADPHSPWQRPSNENTNGLLRQYFPKETDLSRWSAEDLEAVAHTLNNRPRKTLRRMLRSSRSEQLRSLQQPGVASTG